MSARGIHYLMPSGPYERVMASLAEPVRNCFEEGWRCRNAPGSGHGPKSCECLARLRIFCTYVADDDALELEWQGIHEPKAQLRVAKIAAAKLATKRTVIFFTR